MKLFYLFYIHHIHYTAPIPINSIGVGFSINSLLDHNLAQLHNRIHIFAEKFDGLKKIFAKT